MSRVLITGASGYTGHKLVHFLNIQGVETHALLRASSESRRLPEGITIHRLPMDLRQLIRCVRPDAIYHLAAPAGSASGRELDEWVRFSRELIEAATTAPNCRFILAGSWWQFDPQGNVRPCTPYAAAKQTVHEMLDNHASDARLSACTAILYDIFGPDDWRNKILLQLVRTQKPLAATSGTQIMDLVHVDDVVSGLMACAATREANKAGLYTIGGIQRLSLRELADMVGQLRGHPVEMCWGELPSGPAPMLPCPANNPPPSWRAKIKLEDGLQQVIAYDQ